MYFKSKDHKNRFASALQAKRKINKKDGTIDKEYGAALYILTAELGTWNRVDEFVEHGIDFTDILENIDFSSAYRVLIETAANLFNETNQAPALVDIPTRLDEPNFLVAMAAILIRRYGLHISASLIPQNEQTLSALKEEIDGGGNAYLTIYSQDRSYQEIHHVCKQGEGYLYDLGSFQTIGGYEPITKIDYPSWDEMINKLSAAKADDWIISHLES